MIMTMVQTGMRVGELVNFKPNWINWQDKIIHIQKNTKPIKWTPKRESERKVPINDSILKILKRQISNRKTGYVFQSQKWKSTNIHGDRRITKRIYGCYTYGSIIRKINNISQKVLEKNIGTHIFRATYALHLLKAKLDLESIRKLLGHSDIKATLIYLRGLPDYNSWDEVRNVELMNLVSRN